MKRHAVLCLALLAGLGGAARLAPAASTATGAPAGKGEVPCGLPQQQPLWVDFADGSVPFWSTIFARPGIVGAAANFIVPPQLRAGGAKTVFFDLNFHNRMGSPSAPVDPASIQDRADKLFDTAAQSSACATPLIALNELFGAQTPMPWTATITQYRANVLAFVQRLAERGARPFLLLSSSPYTGGEAADWWRQVAQYTDLVPEVYFNGRILSNQGPTLANRRLRSVMRNRINDLVSLGVPPARIGIMLTFSSTPNAGGREGLQPLSKWLDVVKWEALAANQVAAETKIATVWSWGWGTWTVAGNDPDKQVAACVYLWTRDRSLCDAPKLAGRQLDTSLTAGQVALGKGVLCVLGTAPLKATTVAELARVTGDKDIAFTAALQRLVLAESATASPADVLAAERNVIVDRFRGSRAAYVAALQARHATVNMGRAVLGDELRRRAVETTLGAKAPTSREIGDYYDTFGAEPARFVRAAKPVAWLGNRKEGVALSATAPGRLFALAPDGATAIDRIRVQALGETAPLSAFELSRAIGSIRSALVALAREDAFHEWGARKQAAALKRLACDRDSLPEVASVDLTEYLPFLALP